MMHLERHMYKKGKNKGDAPAYSNRRGMSHYRVVKGNDGTMRVRMWGTDILTANQDGSVLIDTNGWHDRNTTIVRLNDALSMFLDDLRVRMYRSSVFSYSQPVLNVDGKRFSYYDGITLNVQGEVTTPLRAFEQKRIDRAETKDFANGLKTSGFKDTFPLLYAMTTEEDRGENDYSLFGVDWQDVLTNNEQADKWKLIIARCKFERRYSFSASNGGGYMYEEKSNAKACWASIMQYCKKNMYVVSRSETFVL
jgi:hypothetical protein